MKGRNEWMGCTAKVGGGKRAREQSGERAPGEESLRPFAELESTNL
jgi:hypothetical protein